MDLYFDANAVISCMRLGCWGAVLRLPAYRHLIAEHVVMRGRNHNPHSPETADLATDRSRPLCGERKRGGASINAVSRNRKAVGRQGAQLLTIRLASQ